MIQNAVVNANRMVCTGDGPDYACVRCFEQNAHHT